MKSYCWQNLSSKCVLGFYLLLIAQQVFAGDTQVSMSVNTNNKLSLQAFGVPIVSKTSADPLNQSIQGLESSQCQPYGRSSAASGGSRVVVKKNKPEWFTITLDSDANAHGGHFRTCFACVQNQCLGIHGNDTKGDASADATAVVTVAFDPEFRHPSDYLLNISATGQQPLLSLKDGKQNSLEVRGKDGGASIVTWHAWSSILSLYFASG